jgi:putative intracellular protease/amidase
LCSTKGGDATKNVDPNSLADIENDANKKAFWESEANQKTLSSLQPLSAYNGADFNVVMLVGGFGVMFDFFPNADIDRVSRECYENNNGVIGAVCHGPIGLASIKLSNGDALVKGKNVAGFTDGEEDVFGLGKYYPTDVYPTTGFTVETILKELGANYSKVDNWGVNVVTDGRIVSGQNPASADGVGEAIVAVVASL